MCMKLNLLMELCGLWPQELVSASESTCGWLTLGHISHLRFTKPVQSQLSSLKERPEHYLIWEGECVCLCVWFYLYYPQSNQSVQKWKKTDKKCEPDKLFKKIWILMLDGFSSDYKDYVRFYFIHTIWTL